MDMKHVSIAGTLTGPWDFEKFRLLAYVWALRLGKIPGPGLYISSRKIRADSAATKTLKIGLVTLLHSRCFGLPLTVRIV